MSCSVDETYRDQGISFNETIGMGRAPMADPDRVESYGPAYHSEKDFRAKRQPLQRLLVPMDSRTLASATGSTDYLFVRHGGSSWVCVVLSGKTEEHPWPIFPSVAANGRHHSGHLSRCDPALRDDHQSLPADRCLERH